MGARGGSELERGEIEVAGVRRSYWLARSPRRDMQSTPPLLIALHGSGMDGRAMAWFTGLASRGPAAGITTVFYSLRVGSASDTDMLSPQVDRLYEVAAERGLPSWKSTGI